MAFGTFGSAWRESAFYTEPDESLHVADPSHAEESFDPNPVWKAPADINDQADFLYSDDMVVGGTDGWVADNPGQLFDMTTYTHDFGNDTTVTTSGVDTISANAAIAGRSEGADIQRQYEPPMVQDYTTTYISKRFEGLSATEVSPVALQRGLNSLPENNPDGFRFGWVEQTWVDRKFQIGERTHDRRWVTPNTAYAEVNQEAVPGTNGTPFDTLARALTTISQTPMMRREPVSMSESITTDGSEQTYQSDAISGDWVAG